MGIGAGLCWVPGDVSPAALQDYFADFRMLLLGKDVLAHAQSAIQGKDVLAHAREIIVENIGGNSFTVSSEARITLQKVCKKAEEVLL